MIEVSGCLYRPSGTRVIVLWTVISFSKRSTTIRLMLLALSIAFGSDCLQAELISTCTSSRWSPIESEDWTGSMSVSGTTEASCWYSKSTASYGTLSAYGEGQDLGPRQVVGRAEASFRQIATFSGYGQGYLAMFTCSGSTSFATIQVTPEPSSRWGCGRLLLMVWDCEPPRDSRRLHFLRAV